MIDPISCVIQYLLTQSTITNLVGTRIGPQQRYGDDWDRATASLVIQWAGGPSDLYLPVQTQRAEVRAIAPTLVEATGIWGALVTLSRTAERVPVTVGGQTGLLYAILQEGGPMALYDSDAELPCMYGFYNIIVGENPLT